MGKAFSFFAFMWLIVTLAGSILQGSISSAATTLTAAITASSGTITVRTTSGFPGTGIVVTGDERIAYASTTATTFRGNLATPLVRGANNTTAAAHSSGAVVRTVEGGMMNTAATYNLAVIADASGLWAAVTIPIALFRLILSFLVLPVGFLGTDLAIIGVIWWVMVAGMLVSMGIALAGARRV